MKTEVAITNNPAWRGIPDAVAEIIVDGKLAGRIVATTELSQGADSGYYSVARLKWEPVRDA